MSYVVLCTFYLKNASSTDYQHAYADLEQLGLHRPHTTDRDAETVIPTTTVLGSFADTDADAIRDAIREQVRAAFTARGLASEFFVVVGGPDWTWGASAS